MLVLRASPCALLVALAALSPGCRTGDQEQAQRRCDEARALDSGDQRRALEIRRQIHEEVPTSGTRAARECVREVRERMGKVRALVSHDEIGEPDTVAGCGWAADAMEVFAGSANLPYRDHWARRLAERCLTVVGRAWTRAPDSKPLADLSSRLKKLAAEPTDE
jgi:hypothetical protein